MTDETRKLHAIVRLCREMKALGVSAFEIDGIKVAFDSRAFAQKPSGKVELEEKPAFTPAQQNEIDLFYSSSRPY